MDEDILAELERQLTNVNLDKYWTRKIGDFELWLTSIDYTQSNRVRKVLDGEFGLEEAKRVTLSSAIIGVNGVDLRPLRSVGKTIKVPGKDGKKELVDLPEYIYRKIANWDAEFVDTVFEVYADILESHKKDLVKDIVFENAKNPEEELAELEEKVAALRERLGKPPLVEAKRLDEEPQDEPAPEQDSEPDVDPDSPARPDSSFEGAEGDFDPFRAVQDRQEGPPVQSAPDDLPPPPSVPQAGPAVPVPLPPSGPSEIELAMVRRKTGQSGQVAPSVLRPPAQALPSVPDEVLERGASRVITDPPSVNPVPGSQSRNPRFRSSGVR